MYIHNQMFERMDLFYDLNLDDLLYTGWKPDSNSGIHLVRAQTTSYQNFWQEMGNVQTLTEAEQREASSSVSQHLTAPSGGTDQRRSHYKNSGNHG